MRSWVVWVRVALMEVTAPEVHVHIACLSTLNRVCAILSVRESSGFLRNTLLRFLASNGVRPLLLKVSHGSEPQYLKLDLIKLGW